MMSTPAGTVVSWMRQPQLLVAVIGLTVLMYDQVPAIAAPAERPVLIVVSYDAFRNEYLQRNTTAFMNELRRNGTTSAYLRNVFPTKTFPNHHSIATGVYPNVHGVLANGLYDSQRGGALNYSYELFHYNRNLLPIWVSTSGFWTIAFIIILSSIDFRFYLVPSSP